MPYLRVDDANTRTGALDALRAMPQAVRPHLPALLADADPDVRLLACDLVRDAGGADGPRWLCAMLETEPQANVCAAAVEVLGEIADAAAVPSLSRCAERFPDDPFLGSPSRSSPTVCAPRRRRLVAELRTLNAEEFRRLCDFLYRHTGMAFTEARRYFVERRVEERMIATAASSFASYFARLRANMEGEVETLINAFTVNETYFYREDHQFTCLTSDLLRERLRVKPLGEALRIWSLPCSTGEEPYSIAIWLLENWPQVDAHDVEIVGSDIDTDALEAARAGIFGKRALMRLTRGLIDKYFTPAGPEHWRILDDLRQSVQFTAANLVDADRNPAARPVRCDLLPQRADLFRRRFAPHGGGKSL